MICFDVTQAAPIAPQLRTFFARLDLPLSARLP